MTKPIQQIDFKQLETPIGTMFACAVPEGICLLEFTERKILQQQYTYLTKALNAEIVPGENPHFLVLEQQLKEYFEGHRKTFSVPLVIPGTDFRVKAWQGLQQIPYGTVRSYKEQAAALGTPDAIRAVASANGANRISIIIPCHRLVASDGALTGYGGGVWRKQWLLDFEEKHK